MSTTNSAINYTKSTVKLDGSTRSVYACVWVFLKDEGMIQIWIRMKHNFNHELSWKYTSNSTVIMISLMGIFFFFFLWVDHILLICGPAHGAQLDECLPVGLGECKGPIWKRVRKRSSQSDYCNFLLTKPQNFSHLLTVIQHWVKIIWV